MAAVPYNRLTWNTHMDRTMNKTTWRWIRLRFPRIHVLYLQEVARPDNARKVLGKGWTLAPVGAVKTGEAMKPTTYLAYRNKRFRDVKVGTADTTYGSKWGRRVVHMTGWDKRSRRPVSEVSVHVDPLGNGFYDANPVARDRHMRQIATAATVASLAATTPDVVAAVGGDMNERLWDARPGHPLTIKSAVSQFANAGYTPAFRITGQRVNLDDIFVRKARYVRNVRRIQLRPPFAGFDHDVVWVGVKVRKAPKR